MPAGIQGVLKAGANIGSVVGQFGFGEFISTALSQPASDNLLLLKVLLPMLLVVKPSVRIKIPH
jgi:ABC-type proline/glycine betaine transport system permease subunit